MEANKKYILVGSGSCGSGHSYHGANWTFTGSMTIPTSIEILNIIIENACIYMGAYGVGQDRGAYSEHVYYVKTTEAVTVTYNTESTSASEACSSATLVAIPM